MEKKFFIYKDKKYPWIKTGEGSNTLEDCNKSCTDLEEQIEIIKFIQSVEGNSI